MKTRWISVLALAVATGAPAAAQDNEAWPVDADGSICSTSRISSATSDGLVVSYTPASQELKIETAVETAEQAGSGTRPIWVIFDKGSNEELDIAWGYRTFAYRSDDGRLELMTRFTGQKNVDQLLTDLGSSERLGFVFEKKTIADFDLEGIRPALSQLRACARTLAAR